MTALVVPGRPDGAEVEAGGESTAPAAGRRRDVRLVGAGMAVVLLAWFALVNRQDVRIHFWLASARAPLVAVIAIAGVFGAAIGALAVRFSGGRRRRHGA